MTHRRFRVAIVRLSRFLAYQYYLGWRSDEFVSRLLWLSGANDLLTDQHILEPPTIAWSQVRWSGDIQDPRLNESSGSLRVITNKTYCGRLTTAAMDRTLMQ